PWLLLRAGLLMLLRRARFALALRRVLFARRRRTGPRCGRNSLRRGCGSGLRGRRRRLRSRALVSFGSRALVGLRTGALLLGLHARALLLGLRARLLLSA